MFTVNTNRAIKMNRGDDVQFPLFVNIGDRRNWVRYEFSPVIDPTRECDEVYFFILPLHCGFEDYVLKKTFSCNGTIITSKPNENDDIVIGQQNINANKDMVIRLWESDTLSICPGEYVYAVRAKILTSRILSKNIITTGDNLYTTLTITNKYPFYLLDDDIIRAD